MYKYISRPDCYYTDTDSAILGSPLPEEEVSSTELGKLKLEHIVDYGDQESTIIKFELKFQRDEIHRLKSELTKSKEHLDKSASIQELLLIALLACFICWMAWLAIDYSPVGAKLEHCYELLKFQRDEIHSLKSELTKSKEHFIKMTQELRDQMKQERIDGLSKMIDDQAKITVDFNARIIEEIQRQNKLIQNKDAQLDDLREMNASLIKNNEEIDRLEAKLGKTTKLPTHKPKEPSWWKEKE
jgi:hypothetical protein